MKYKTITQKDLRAVENNGLYEDVKYPLNCLEDIEYYINQLEQVLSEGLPFGIYVRGSSDGMDFWLQAEYYSTKLKKTIIWDYDWNNNFENEKELLDAINKTAKDIVAFEAKITLKK